jgi:hypothetical protein
MTNNLKPTEIARTLLRSLRGSAAGDDGSAREEGLDARLALLRGWQCERLAKTHADLLADARYGPAFRFFLSDLYAPRDFSKRDQDVERLYALLSRALPAQTLQLLAEVVELNRLTQRLDRVLSDVLAERLGVTDVITTQAYAEGYRLCDNYDERLRQIALIKTVLLQVGDGARLRLVGATMRLARIPAQRAGWGDLYDLLARGYAVFRPLRDVRTFVERIEQRELRLLERIYAADADPFGDAPISARP